MLSKTQETGVRKLGVTQELLSLVTGLAHYLKLLIRIGLQGTLKLERETNKSDGLQQFLEYLGDLSSLKPEEDATPADLFAGVASLADQQSDCCTACKDPIDDECVILGERRWHIKPPHLLCGSCQKDLTADLQDGRWSEKDRRPFCSSCAVQKGLAPDAQGGFEHVSKLRQYVFLLKVALARLLSVLRSGGTLPHTSGMLPLPAALLSFSLTTSLQMIQISGNTRPMTATEFRRTANSYRRLSGRIPVPGPTPGHPGMVGKNRRLNRPLVRCADCGRLETAGLCRPLTRRHARQGSLTVPKEEARGPARLVVTALTPGKKDSRLWKRRTPTVKPTLS